MAGEQQRSYTRWTGDLQQAYLDALEGCGGLHEATPKALHDVLQPRFPFLSLQHVKNHLQKHRGREPRHGAAGAHGSHSHQQQPASSFVPEWDEQMDFGPSELNPTPAPAQAAAAAATASAGQQAAPVSAAGSVGGNGMADAGGAAAAHPSAYGGGASVWLSEGWDEPSHSGGMVQPNSLAELARRALALTVHQLGLYRKLLEELQRREQDHALLLASLKQDPTGLQVILEARRAAARGNAGGSTAAASGALAAGDAGRPLRMRRIMARLLPPNPFSAGPEADAALKLAAWSAVISKAPLAEDGSGRGLPAGGPAAAAALAAQGAPAAAGVGAVSGSAHPTSTGGASKHPADSFEEDDEDEEEWDGFVSREGPTHRRSKRHKPLSELLAEIPLQGPGLDGLGAGHAVPSPAELQQLLGGPPAALAAAAAAAGVAGAAGAGGAAGGVAGVWPPASAPATPPAGAFLQPPPQQQHAQQQVQFAWPGIPTVQQQAQAGAQPAWQAGQQQAAEGGGQARAMELDEDTMIRALDAQMSSLLLQSVSNALMQTTEEGPVPTPTAQAAPSAAGIFGRAPAAAPGGMQAAAGAAGGAAPQQPLPAGFPSAGPTGMGVEPLSTATADVSILRSLLDMLSGGAGPSPAFRLGSGSLPYLPDGFSLGTEQPQPAPAATAAPTDAPAAAATAPAAAVGGQGGASGKDGGGGEYVHDYHI